MTSQTSSRPGLGLAGMGNKLVQDEIAGIGSAIGTPMMGELRFEGGVN